MAALNFPASPLVGDIYTANGKSWQWDGTSWNSFNVITALNNVAINNSPIGQSTAAAGGFTTLSASSTVSGTGFTTYLASPPAIGGTAANTGKFTTLIATGTTTLATSLTGLLKGTSGVVSTATSGTDYAPATSGSSILYGNGSGGFSNVTVGSNLTFTAGTLNGNAGTVTAISVTTANGFAGTSSGAATPALTLTTSVNGMVKGNGTALSAAVSGTDYQAPIGTISGIAKGNGANALTAAIAGTDYVAPGGALGTPSSGTLSGCTVDGTNGVGYINIPQNAQTASYTLVASDAGKHIYHAAAAAAATYTIPANTSVGYVVGTAITFVNLSTNAVTIAITTDTMYLAGAGTTGSRTLAQYGTATALKITSTSWVISGAGLS